MMEKERAPRNNTLDLTKDEMDLYLNRCVPETDAKSLFSEKKPDDTAYIVQDLVIHGDCFNVIDKIPGKCVDLLIADPPYNMSKSYGMSRFLRMDDGAYATFTRAWIEGIYHTLKESASIYVCSDWESSMIIGPILKEYFTNFAN